MVSDVKDKHQAVEIIWEWILQENRAHFVIKKLSILLLKMSSWYKIYETYFYKLSEMVL